MIKYQKNEFSFINLFLSYDFHMTSNSRALLFFEQETNDNDQNYSYKSIRYWNILYFYFSNFTYF
ncbi:hypothetical protein GLOIN_2v1696460 [Rhizophagus irregularis DAOM 181602=DAOM 197198]|uniref:Uncharacterized protein n=1 Tax=Rhizophagus irregularis (strain DAOM 181602 / DAOM 197198 / MUCL 43194) TaxID=747089 RepID=A0A2P4PAK4_RHIID|nr:hypothetical protein GLOIN_2v1696460 [Rhizophagus irregularis DAOM 181602=DAOM 197198]POG62418.1 hypothetical protein GLOIN_2v1696460 [Rhizophagus irregularis DAOM 181602=DAOM 197198]|eukprot:XP_025169284.1 hypothetical protein GLOIN_2v1696460 [Rhizophagus irregularis DAOM 181602=DAOM 197198]